MQQHDFIDFLKKYNLKSQVMHHGFIEFLKNGAFEPEKKKID